ncbi:MAG: hypothetical protein AUJ96_33240 [Armatimonadetes bacterium CG2_30_66_41]|nr:MAG: hypothetical protein AUJ96_33240 [Armatimonadetes bacterium CG2_30_66_41]
MSRILSCALVGSCLGGAGWGQVDLTRPFARDGSTVALFHLDDVTTGRAVDAAGGPAGECRDVAPTLGRFGGGLSCDGVAGWVDVLAPNNSAAGSGLTVECWVKLRGGAHGDVVCRNQSYMIRLEGGFQAYVHLDGAWRKLVGRRPVPTGRWTHLALTYDRASREVRTYIDGRLDVAQVPAGVTEGKLGVGDSTLRLGCNTWNPDSSRLDGKLDEVRISSVARSYTPLSVGAKAAVPADANLIPNPSFEFGLDGWRADGEANARLQWRVERGEAPHGKAFLRSSEARGYSLITRPLAIVPGKVHTLSALMRADKATRVQLALCSTGVPRDASRPSKSQSFGVSLEWKRVAARIAVPEDWPTELAYVSVSKPADAALDLDAVRLVVGEGAEFSQPEAQSVGMLVELPQGNLFSANEPARLTASVVNSGETDHALQVNYTVTDWLGREAAAGKLFEGMVRAGDSVPVQVPVPTRTSGWFALQFALSEQGRLLSEATRTVNVVEPLTGRGDARASPLGMNTHMEREPDAHLDCNLAALSRCGVKWIRAWWGWGMAEKEPGQFDWTEYDRQLAAVHRAGMEIMPILLRYYPQFERDWAGKTDKIQQPPNDLTQWGNFVETTVRRYRGRVKAWEVWNEPQYTMDARTYADILKVTYERIRAADPDAQVVGFAGVSLDYIRDVCEAGSAKCLDVLAHHSYSQLGHPWEQMAKLAADTAALVDQHGATTRVWHSEQGSGADGVGYLHLAETEEQCAVNLVQSNLSALSTGVEKFFWFSAQTSPTYGWGVFYENYVPRPRLVALNGLARLLEGRKVTGRLTLADGQAACVLLDGAAGPAAAVWNLREKLRLKLPAAGDLRSLDMLGNPLTEAALQAAALSVDLAEGRPLYLVAKTATAAELVDLLRRTEAGPLGGAFPVRVTAQKTADGRLEIRLENTTSDNLDARVQVACPELFATAPAAWQVSDLAAHAAQSTALALDKQPAAGTQVEIAATIEVGGHGIRTDVAKLAMAF